MWFKKLTGFHEENPAQVRENLSVEGLILKSHVNDKQYQCGQLEIPSLAELRQRISGKQAISGKLVVNEVIAHAQQLHIDQSNANALFQVASQFNLLEMVHPSVTPEDGVNRYEYDLTQGPACAIAAGAGTIYRNYFAPVNGKIGQTADNQIDCLAEIGAALENSKNQLWQMKNGYALPSLEGLDAINNQIISASELERDELRKLLRIGIQWNTEVTLNEAKHTVTQAYCSALPVSYSNLPAELWAEFAKLILEAAYEATFCAGILNQLNTGNNKIYLTLLGGGAFGNNQEWIINAIARSLELYKSFDLNVFIVSYRYSHPHIQQLISEYQA